MNLRRPTQQPATRMRRRRARDTKDYERTEEERCKSTARRVPFDVRGATVCPAGCCLLPARAGAGDGAVAGATRANGDGGEGSGGSGAASAGRQPARAKRRDSFIQYVYAPWKKRRAANNVGNSVDDESVLCSTHYAGMASAAECGETDASFEGN